MSTHVSTAPLRDSTQPVSRWERFVPLSGVAFFLLLLISAVSGGETPSDYASGAKVVSLFKAHAGAQKVSNLIAAVGIVFLVFFASWLRDYLRGRGAGPLASAVFGGALVMAVGGAARAGIGWALASGHDKLDPSAAQALNVVFATHYPAIAGIAVFMFAASASILRTGALPAWLGWAALPIALIAIAPPTLVPLIASSVWMAVAGIVLFVRDVRLDTPT
jgi:hypothetical protein